MRLDSLLPAVYAPLRSLADVEALERVPLEERIGSWDFAASLLVGCRRDPEKPALHYVENGDSAAPALTWSYGELERHATQIANLLRSRGIRAGDAVAVVTPTLPALYASVLGAFLAGRPFPVNWMLLADPLRELLVHADVKAVIALGPTPGYAIWDNIEAACRARPDIAVFSIAGPGGRALPESDVLVAAESHPRDRLAFERAPAQAGDVAAYVHSGGTTGAPKIVKLTHGGLVYRQWATNVGLAFRADEVLLADTPMFHIGGFCVRGLVPVANGTTIVIPTPLGARDKTYLTHYWRFVERFRITQLSGVPTTLSVLAKQPPQGEDISSLRPCFSTGSTAIAP
jgi:fatty-acyl-CoA synthase